MDRTEGQKQERAGVDEQLGYSDERLGLIGSVRGVIATSQLKGGIILTRHLRFFVSTMCHTRVLFGK